MNHALRIPRKNKKNPPIDKLAANIADYFEWVALFMQ